MHSVTGFEYLDMLCYYCVEVFLAPGNGIAFPCHASLEIDCHCEETCISNQHSQNFGYVASSPDLQEPGTHCMHMRQDTPDFR